VDQRLPRRPYLLRAMHQWMSDSGMTPHVLVDTYVEGVDVPKAHVRDGRIVLNLGFSATRHLDLGNDWITFEARFAGVPRGVRIPVPAVLSIYARETGEGMVFPPEGELAPPSALLAPRLPDTVVPQGLSVPGSASGGAQGGDGPPQPPRGPSRPRPNLKVVK
jgi:stringent starvation protein B